MGLKQLNWVLERSPYTGAAFAIHLALADVANEHKNDEVWLKRDELGQKARVKSKSNISKILKQMCEDGMLELVEDNSRSGFNSAQTYRLLMPEDQAMVYDVKHVGGDPAKPLKKRHQANAPAHSFRKGSTVAQQTAKKHAEQGEPSLFDTAGDVSQSEVRNDVVELEVIDPTRFDDLEADSPFDGIDPADDNGVSDEHPIADGAANGVLQEHTGGASGAHQGCSESTPNKNPSEHQPNGSAEAEAAVAASASSEEVVEATEEAVTTAATSGIEQSSGQDVEVIEAEVVTTAEHEEHPSHDEVIEAEIISDDTEVVVGILVRDDQVPNDIVPAVEWAYDRDQQVADQTASLPRGVDRNEFFAAAALYSDLRVDLPQHGVTDDDIKTYAGKVLGAYVTWRKLNLGVPMLPKWRGDVVKMVKALLKDGWSPMAALDVVMHWHDRSMSMVRSGRDPLAPGAIRSIAQGFLEADAGAVLHGVDGTGRTAKEKHADDVDVISGQFAEGGW